jgi:tRNA C32,U32 (ribose-2'-O)-methylase TrmJ
MDQFLSFNIGQVAQIIVYVAGIVWLFSKVSSDVRYQNNRLVQIETEIIALKNLIISTAKLEERIDNIRYVVLSQGKRLDRLVERVYGKRPTTTEDDESLS